MASAVADTSFLFSLFGNDAHTPAAKRWVQQTQLPLTVTTLGRYELGNAIRFATFRQAISRADALASLAAFEADFSSGHLQPASCDVTAIVNEASRISGLHTMNGGHRSFDILHVATARLLNATCFLSFDANQRKLATSLQLNVGP